MKNKRTLTLAVCLLVFGLMLAACTSGANGSRFSFLDDYTRVSVMSQDTSDTPWGFTCGAIDYEGKTCLLMLPNAECSVKLKGTLETLSWTWQIHPWVAESSDGAAIHISITDESTSEVLLEKDVDLKQSDKALSEKLELNLTQEREYRVAIHADTGASGVADCDWLLFEALEVTGDFAVTSQEKPPEPQVSTEDYLISANYFCGGWPKNLWDCEPTDVNGDLAKLRQDGFNSIILLIPWRQFQPEIEPVSYNSVAFDRLEAVMQAADENDLKVFLRIGYYHDFYQNEDASELGVRFSHLFQPGKYRQAFMEYAAEVYSRASEHESYTGAFICWEDFWGIVNELKSSDSADFHLSCAKILGYQDYLAENYTLDEWNSMYGTSFGSFDDIPVPFVNEPAFRTFYDAFDQALNQLLYDAQKVVPNLSMEVRLDADLVLEEDGSQIYYSHDATYLCEGSDFVSTVYGIPMGCLNQGERITADEALEKTKYILENLNSKIGGKNLYVEQFLFYDDTVKFSYNARLKEDEVSPYLHQVHNILRQNTCGIGIWTYQNYQFNAVYNWQFADGLNGWETTGDVQLVTVNTSCAALGAGSSIAQIIPLNRSSFVDGDTLTLCFTVCDDAAATMTVTVGNQQKIVSINGAGEYSLEFSFKASESTLPLTLSTDSNVTVDNINLYNYVQNGLLYDVYGNELSNIADMRVLIQNLLNYGNDGE